MLRSGSEAVGSLTVPEQVLEMRNRGEVQVTCKGLGVYWKPVEMLLACCGRY